MYQLQKSGTPIWNAKDPIYYDESQRAWMCDNQFIVDVNKEFNSIEVAGDGPYGMLPVPIPVVETQATGEASVIG